MISKAKQSKAKQSKAEQSISFRLATLNEAKKLFEWRNDESTRMASHNSNKLELDEHMKWLENTINNKDRELFIVEKNGLPIGTIRADYDGSIYELSWTVAPVSRGTGVGKIMVKEFIKVFNKPIRAEVKFENKASQKIAEYSGMNLIKIDSNDVLHYEKI